MYGNQAVCNPTTDRAAAEKFAYAQSQMLGVGTTDTPRQAPVEAALDDLEVSVKHAYDQLDQLVSRLMPVLKIANKAEKAGGTSTPASCMLEGRISDMAKGVHELVSRIQSIRAALCI